MQALNISENIIENKQLKLDNESLKQKLKKIKHTVNFLRKNTDSSLLKALEKNNELENVNIELVSDNEALKKKMEAMESKMKEMELDQIRLEYKSEQAQGKPDCKEEIK